MTYYLKPGCFFRGINFLRHQTTGCDFTLDDPGSPPHLACKLADSMTHCVQFVSHVETKKQNTPGPALFTERKTGRKNAGLEAALLTTVLRLKAMIFDVSMGLLHVTNTVCSDQEFLT